MKNRFLATFMICTFFAVATRAQNVGIGEPNPASKLSVKGGLSVGTNFSTQTAPSNGLIVEGSLGIGTIKPDTNSVLDISSTKKGLMLPRLTRAQRLGINNPTKGLFVFDTDSNTLYFHDGTNWFNMAAATSSGTIVGGSNFNWATGGNGGGTGVTGPTGATGPAGANGTNGTNGAAGATGATGSTGPAGTNGTNGATGPTGATGPAGTNGTNGATGPTGATGPAGANGTNGTNGVNGATGATGPTGATGAAGTNGTNGTNGATGATGPTGATGAAGTNGTNGTNGATGATGANGATGSTGATGAGYTATSTTSTAIATGSKTFTTQSGLAYLANMRVRVANSATSYMEGLVSSYSGTTLIVTVDRTVGSGTYASWNIGIAGDAGATGATGTAGTNGTNGATGATGPTGPTGTAGTNGTNGTNGATGATGPTGATGTAGTNGTNGATGSTGATGAGYTATSTTSSTIGTGSKTFTTQSGLAYLAGIRVRVANSSTSYMEGTVTSYSGTSLVVSVDRTVGSGTYTSWNIGVAGDAGSFSFGSAAGNTPYWNGTSWVVNSSNIYNNGANIGIGTTSPLSDLDVAGNLAIGTYAGANAAPTNGLIVSGNVGIGTASPSYKLDVAGTGRFTGALTVGAYTLPATDGTSGQVLVTNGSGTLTWSGSIAGVTTFVGDKYTAGCTNCGISNTGTTTSYTQTYSSGITAGKKYKVYIQTFTTKTNGTVQVEVSSSISGATTTWGDITKVGRQNYVIATNEVYVFASWIIVTATSNTLSITMNGTFTGSGNVNWYDLATYVEQFN